MFDLLEKILRVDEDAAGLKSLHKIYKGQEQRLDPDPADLFTALIMMEKYYKEYLAWYAEYAGAERNIKELPVRQDYQKRLREIQKALKSKDTKEQMIALDNAINQWHIDFPVIDHLGMDDTTEDMALANLAEEIAVILDRLGRLPKESPYANIYASVKESSIDYKSMRMFEARGYWRDWTSLRCSKCDWVKYRKHVKKSQPEVLKTMKCPECGAELKLEESIEESSIDFPRETLDLAVWDKEEDSYVLKDEIKKQITDLMSKYSDKDLNAIAKEIRIVGSIATNQYIDDADVDVHVVPENTDEWSEEEVNNVVRWFNENRDEIDGRIEKHPIEIYVQLYPNQDLMSDGCYNMLDDEWLVGPKIAPMSLDPYEDFSHIADDIRNAVEDADVLLGELKRDVIDYEVIKTAMEGMSGEDKERLLQKLQDKLNELEDDIEALYKKRGEWVDARHEASKPETPEQALKDVELAKKWRDTNAIFKFVNRYHYLKAINDLRELLADEEITPDEIDKIKSIMGIH